MPELPEVETVRRGLAAQLQDAEITAVEIFTPHVMLLPEPQRLVGQRLEGFRRRAKYLILELSQDRLLIHLRMTGQLLILPADPQESYLPLPFTYYQRPLAERVDKHTHGLLHFANGLQLAYRDIRKFGRVEQLTPAQLAASPSLNKLGPEPLEKAFQLKPFQTQLAKAHKPVKAFLLDQTKVAGLGNIYVDEALFVARIHPARSASSLKPAEIKRLFQAIPFVLQKGIDAGGTTLKDFLHPDGQQGEHQEHLFVYGRKGLACFECQTPVSKTVLAQRGTHFCPVCQPSL